MARAWAEQAVIKHSGVLALGYFGSYARGDWGVGSDLDLIAIVELATEPFERRGLSWDLLPLPVPATLLVYTVAEWCKLVGERGRFVSTIRDEAVWMSGAPP